MLQSKFNYIVVTRNELIHLKKKTVLKQVSSWCAILPISINFETEPFLVPNVNCSLSFIKKFKMNDYVTGSNFPNKFPSSVNLESERLIFILKHLESRIGNSM